MDCQRIAWNRRLREPSRELVPEFPYNAYQLFFFALTVILL